MQKLFGLPIDNLLYGLLIILAIGILGLIYLALRNLVLFKTGVRNITRHPIQTCLIIFGLMLATLLISASLITGDTMNYSIKKMAIEDLGKTDEVVEVKTEDNSSGMMQTGTSGTENTYFSMKYFNKVKKALPENIVDGVAAVVKESAPAAAPRSKRNLPSMGILGLQNNFAKQNGVLISTKGTKLSIDDLSKDEAYINDKSAEKLDAKTGDKIKLYIGEIPKTVKVAGIYDHNEMPSSTGPTLIMPIKKVQQYFGKDSKINNIFISNNGNELTGVKYSKKVVAKLKPFLKESSLNTKELKKDVLDDAEEAAGMFTSIFLVFGQFSTIAGIMLIFLIFIMLAAERKVELGVLRALGTQSRDILRIFLFEGSVYAVIAAAVGSVLGIAVGWGIVKVLAKAFGTASESFKLYYYFNVKSLIIAYAMGVIATFIVVLFSAWRAGRINIVRAIRDLPEPRKKGTNIKRIISSVLMIFFGVILIASGVKTNQSSSFFMGISLLIIGIPFLAWGFQLPDRVAFSIAGIGLLLLWLLPDSIINQLLPWSKDMKSGIEMFFVSGVAIVAGSVWIVMYNSDIILKFITTVFGKIKGLPPVLKIAVNYPMKNRFRTGLALAMFSLIVFTIVFMSVIISSMSPVFENIKGMSGDYNIRGITSYANPVKNIRKTIDKNGDGIKSSDFVSIGSFSMAGINIRQKGAKKKTWKQLAIQGIDEGYAKSTNYKIDLMDSAYKSSRDVWKALVNNKNLAVVHTSLVPAKTDYNMGEQTPDFMLSGFYREDKKMPEIFLEVKNPATGKITKLKVIGMINDFAIYANGGIFTSQKTINKVMKVPAPKIPPTIYGQMKSPEAQKAIPVIPQTVPATTYWFKVKSGVSISKASKALAKTFYKNGMETTILKDEISDFSVTNTMMNRLIQGFMGFGLIIGIAALGVIAARSVVERRKQIGMLRAIGFRKGMVQNTFILESSFVALLGIAIGIALGLTLSQKVVLFMAKTLPGVVYVLPWTDIFVIIALAYGASLLTTFLPARQAAKVYPAEALRYE